MLAGLIRTIGTVVLIWFVFRWLDRIARKWSNRGAPNQTDQPPHSASKGSSSPKDQKLGDYVDFEELKDKE